MASPAGARGPIWPARWQEAQSRPLYSRKADLVLRRGERQLVPSGLMHCNKRRAWVSSFDRLVGARAGKPRTHLTPGADMTLCWLWAVSATSRPYGTRAYKRPDEVSTPSKSLAFLRSRVSKPSLNQP